MLFAQHINFFSMRLASVMLIQCKEFGTGLTIHYSQCCRSDALLAVDLAGGVAGNAGLGDSGAGWDFVCGRPESRK